MICWHSVASGLMKLFWSASDQLMGEASSPGLEAGRSGDHESEARSGGVWPESLDREMADWDRASLERTAVDEGAEAGDDASFTDELAPTQMTRCG
ncbi:hypothetical protein TGAMA5MH_02045 [Trichoderma gamsii]|uniref:Uncharacterized protein n=1 Tax=Trichoderma gamsii TaxID=398673 RepID=A0A2K0TM29_9HYPO|nr:hypothetical protein TGAMA5MH_02045 [Trichoderma gamsii]